MSVERDKREELLSGLIDGELSAAEREQLAGFMDSDPTLGALERQYRSLRSALESVPKSQLPSSFAEKVLAGASQRAQQMGADAPGWIPMPHAEPAQSYERPHQTVPARSRRPLVLAASALLVAAASWAIIAFVLQPGSSQQGLLDPSIAKTPIEAPDQNPTPGEELLKDTVPGDQESDEKGAIESIASNKIPEIKPEVAVPAPKAEPSPTTPGPSLVVADALPEVPNGISPEQLQQLQAMEAQLRSGQGLSFMLVVDVTLSPSAWNENRLAEILERHQIPMDDGVQLDDAALQKLLATKMIGWSADNRTDARQVAVVFARSRAISLDRAIQDMYQRVEDFPSFALDMAMDPQVDQALKWLKSLKQFDDTSPVARAMVTSKPSSGSRSLSPQFSVGTRAFKPVSIDRRRAGRPPVELNGDSYCMFLLRLQSAAANSEGDQP
jgi:negative regulator of sigma E activity